MCFTQLFKFKGPLFVLHLSILNVIGTLLLFTAMLKATILLRRKKKSPVLNPQKYKSSRKEVIANYIDISDSFLVIFKVEHCFFPRVSCMSHGQFLFVSS